MDRRVKAISTLMLASALLWFSKSEAATSEKIRFPYSPIAWNSLPWWMAKEGGFFEKYGLDVEMNYEGASSVIVQAMLAGEASFAGLAGPAVVSNVLNGGDVIQVAAVVKTFTIPMYSQASIKEVAQLKGQKVGVSRFNSISHIAALNIFQKAGVTGATIIQTGGIPESAAALMSGNVAAAMVPRHKASCLEKKAFASWSASGNFGNGIFRWSKMESPRAALMRRKTRMWSNDLSGRRLKVFGRFTTTKRWP